MQRHSASSPLSVLRLVAGAAVVLAACGPAAGSTSPDHCVEPRHLLAAENDIDP